MNIELRLDYATMNFDAGCMSSETVGAVLCDNKDVFWQRKGLSDTAPLYSPLGLRWMENNGWQARPHKLEVSGVGCEKFALTLGNLRDAAGKDRYGFSRLDFAFDVLVPRSEWRKFICHAFESSLESERERKKYHLAGTGEAMTVYIGSRRGSKYFRIYNKTLEDPNYTFSENGEEKEVPEDYYVIRYEVELKRCLAGKRLYDPSPLFEQYYSNDSVQNELLINYIRGLWWSFGDDVLLPDGFENAMWSTRYAQKVKFCAKQKGADFTAQDCLEFTKNALHDYPHSFERTINWIVEKLGKYIPYVIQDKNYMDRCVIACKNAFGFVPGYEILDDPEPGFYDIDEIDNENPFEYVPEQTKLWEDELREVTHYDD